MHRRGVVLLLGSLFAVVVVGGSGVRTPWLPGNRGRPAAESIAERIGPRAGTPRFALMATRIRME